MALPMDEIVSNPLSKKVNKSSLAPTPAQSPLDMPEQNLKKLPPDRFQEKTRRTWAHTSTRENIKILLGRIITFGGAAALSVYACHEMVMIVSLAQVTFLQWLMVGFYTITFGWIALAASGAVAGFFFSPRKVNKDDQRPLSSKTALLMPVYNEDPARSFSALAAMAAQLKKFDCHKHFEIFVISDSNDPDKWVKETSAIAQLRQLLTEVMPVWYRRREKNSGKKAGNVADFVRRWGGRYDYMLVLDADSILSAETIITLVQEMESDSRCGILQTVPKLYGGETLFSRLQQFASQVYGGLIARGISIWQGREGNYWGHNALIRVSAFAEAAGLPELPGRKPFGGPIMSHDFVEAALIRRSGWTVKMLPDLGGSWEESPPNLQEVTVRDRRWAQGNMQHMAVLKAKGLRWPNRVHFLIGVMSYLASPLWLAMVAVGLMTYLYVATATFDYFSEEFALFPTWPIFDSERMIQLFILTMTVLLLPKILGWVRACFNRKLGGWLGFIPLTVGVVVETFFSVLYAPIFMMIHTKQAWEILRGKDSGWNQQQRMATKTKLGIYLRRHFWHMLIGVAVSIALYYLSLPLLGWMAPMLIGLVLAAPLSAISGSKRLANILLKLQLLKIPEEKQMPAVMEERVEFENKLQKTIEAIDIPDLIAREDVKDAHFSMVSAPPARKRGDPNVDAVSAKLKINDANSIDEALAWLTREEKLTVLSQSEIFDSLCSLYKSSSAYSHSSERID